MSEDKKQGELYRKLWEADLEAFKMQGGIIATHECLLDEAKADAPEWLKAMLSNVHSVEEAKAFIAFTTPKDNTELFIWFMKWFGEP